MDRNEVAERVAALLLTSETRLEDTISAIAALAAEMPQARQAAGLSMKHGQDALSEATAAIGGLIEVREHIIKAHDHLAALQRMTGMRTIALGGWDKQDEITAAHPDRLKIVRAV